jgi:hypothetical protein
MQYIQTTPSYPASYPSTTQKMDFSCYRVHQAWDDNALSCILVMRQEVNGFWIRRSCLLDKLFTIAITITQKSRLPHDATWLVRRLSCFIFWFLAELVSSALSSALFASVLFSSVLTSALFSAVLTCSQFSSDLFCLVPYILQSDSLEDTFFKGSVSCVLSTGS